MKKKKKKRKKKIMLNDIALRRIAAE